MIQYKKKQLEKLLRSYCDSPDFQSQSTRELLPAQEWCNWIDSRTLSQATCGYADVDDSRMLVVWSVLFPYSFIFNGMLSRQYSTAGDDGKDGGRETCSSVRNWWTILYWQWCNDSSHWCRDVQQWTCYSMAKYFLYSEVIVSYTSGQCFHLFVLCVKLRCIGQWFVNWDLMVLLTQIWSYRAWNRAVDK